MDLLKQALPRQAAGMFAEVVQEVMQKPMSGLVSFGLAATLWATSTGMYAIVQQLNKIFRVEEGRGFLRGRWVAVGLSVLFVGLVSQGDGAGATCRGKIRVWRWADTDFTRRLTVC